ncbi:MAG: YciI family protein [Dehalococcoidia bacterium]
MAQYFAIRTRATRPAMRAEGLNETERAAYARHVPWLQAQVDAGVMIFVGRTALAVADGWALGIIKAESEEAARQIMNSDPFVQDGVVVPELIAFEVIRVEAQNV